MRLELFEQLGLNTTEVKTLLYLYEVGRSRATAVARKLGLPRSTVYSVMEGLEQKRLVSLERGKGAKSFVANHPSALHRIVDNEKQKLRKAEHAAAELAETLEPFFRTKNLNMPKLKFFNGNKNVESMLYDNLAQWEQSILAADGVIWGFQDHSFVERYQPWLSHFWKRNNLPTQRISIHLFSNEARVEKGLKGKVPGREVRRFPANVDFDSSLWVMGDFLACFHTRTSPHYAFHIKDANLGTNLRMVFKLLWSHEAPAS